MWVRDDVRGEFAHLLAQRAAQVESGRAGLGWKLGFGSAAAQAGAGIDAPLVGYLLAEGVTPSGGAIDVSGWQRPVLEPEIAVHLGADVPAGASDADILDALAAVSLAFELVDITAPLDDAIAAIRANVFQRGVVLGERMPVDLHPGGVSIRFAQSTGGEGTQSTGGRGTQPIGGEGTGTEIAAAADPADAVGGYVAVVRHLADALAACGETLRAGDVVITGMVTPPVPMAPGVFSMHSAELGSISLVVT